MWNPYRLRRKWSRPRVFSTLHAALISKEITFPAASLLLLHTGSSGGVIPRQWLQPDIHHHHERCKVPIRSTCSYFFMHKCQAYKADVQSCMKNGGTVSFRFLLLQQLGRGIWGSQKILILNKGCRSLWKFNYRLKRLHVMDLAWGTDLQQLSCCSPSARICSEACRRLVSSGKSGRGAGKSTK